MDISFTDFQKLDLRVGRVESVEEVAGLDKILKLAVDLGELGSRTILAGIKGCYRPRDLSGKLIVVVANLEPREIKGIKSEGMLLAAVTDEGMPVILTPDREAKPGSKIS